jgi:hypothetical protein
MRQHKSWEIVAALGPVARISARIGTHFAKRRV